MAEKREDTGTDSKCRPRISTEAYSVAALGKVHARDWQLETLAYGANDIGSSSAATRG